MMMINAKSALQRKDADVDPVLIFDGYRYSVERPNTGFALPRACTQKQTYPPRLPLTLIYVSR